MAEPATKRSRTVATADTPSRPLAVASMVNSSALFSNIVDRLGPQTPPDLKRLLVLAAQRDSTIALELETLGKRHDQAHAEPPTSQPLLDHQSTPPTLAAAQPAKRKRNSAPAPAKQPAKDRTFEAELDRAEVLMGYTGKYDKYSDKREFNAAFKVESDLGDITSRMADTVADPNSSRVTKLNAITAIRDIMVTVLEAPPGQVARHCRNYTYDLEANFERAFNALSPEHRALLADENRSPWLGDLKKVEELAASYCTMEVVRKVRQRLEANEVPS